MTHISTCPVCGDRFETLDRAATTTAKRHSLNTDTDGIVTAERLAVAVISVNGIAIHHCEELPRSLRE